MKKTVFAGLSISLLALAACSQNTGSVMNNDASSSDAMMMETSSAAMMDDSSEGMMDSSAAMMDDSSGAMMDDGASMEAEMEVKMGE